MTEIAAIAGQNLLSPMVLFFLLGLAAGLARSDLSVPEAAAKAMALYLMLAIGFKGGAEVARQGLSAGLVTATALGLLMAVLIPLVAFALLRATTRLDRANAAAVCAHYGSISVVTFVAGTSFLEAAGFGPAGYMVAVMALMETPAIIIGLWLAKAERRDQASQAVSRGLFREVFLNGSVVLLLGSFAIGMAAGEKGHTAIAPFIDSPFKGVLCLFLLDMGLIAAQRLRTPGVLSPALLAFGIYMPLLAGVSGAAAATAAGLETGAVFLLAVLSASASYIAVPAAMRMALPQANPAVYLTLSLAVTFPFNLTLGIPLYASLASDFAGW